MISETLLILKFFLTINKFSGKHICQSFLAVSFMLINQNVFEIMRKTFMPPMKISAILVYQ